MSASMVMPTMAAAAAMPPTAPFERPSEEDEESEVVYATSVSLRLEALSAAMETDAVWPKGSAVGSEARVLPIAVM